MPLGFDLGIEKRLVNLSTSSAPTFAAIGKVADGVGVGGIANLGKKAASAVLPTARNCIEHVEHENAQFDRWLRLAREEAKARVDGNNKPTGEFTAWVLATNRELPKNPFPGGENVDGTPWYICRTFRMGGLHIGRTSLKPGRTQLKRALFRIDDADYSTEDFEVLVSNHPQTENVLASLQKDERITADVALIQRIQELVLRAKETPGATFKFDLQWTPVLSPFKESDRNLAGKILIPGGTKEDGTHHFIARAEYHQTTYPSMVSENMKSVTITFGGREIPLNTFEVLIATPVLVAPTTGAATSEGQDPPRY